MGWGLDEETAPFPLHKQGRCNSGRVGKHDVPSWWGSGLKGCPGSWRSGFWQEDCMRPICLVERVVQTGGIPGVSGLPWKPLVAWAPCPGLGDP